MLSHVFTVPRWTPEVEIPCWIGYEGPELAEYPLHGDEKYYKTPVEPVGSPLWVYNRLSPVDRKEIASDCFQSGHFDWKGDISCVCGMGWTRLSKMYFCEEEYFCEVIASILLMPPMWFDSIKNLGLPMDAIIHAAGDLLEPWMVRFRFLINGIEVNSW